jgi:hypothetical protein
MVFCRVWIRWNAVSNAKPWTDKGIDFLCNKNYDNVESAFEGVVNSIGPKNKLTVMFLANLLLSSSVVSLTCASRIILNIVQHRHGIQSVP